jgi:hypothetical protein
MTPQERSDIEYLAYQHLARREAGLDYPTTLTPKERKERITKYNNLIDAYERSAQS